MTSVIPTGGDDTENIQNAILNAMKTDGKVSLGRGVFNVYSTIFVNQSADIEICGEGLFDPTNTGPGWSDIGTAVGTKILWKGVTNKTMFQNAGSMRTTFKNLYLDGNGNTSILIQCLTSPVGWACTGTVFHNLTLAGSSIGIDVGEPSDISGSNNDEFTFRDVNNYCEIGVRINNVQSMGHHVEHFENFGSIGIEINRGGQWSIDRFYQDGQNPNRTGIIFRNGGPNVPYLGISNGHNEGGKYLSLPDGDIRLVEVKGFCHSDMTTIPWDVGENVKLKISSSHFWSDFIKFTGHGSPRVVLENCVGPTPVPVGSAQVVIL